MRFAIFGLTVSSSWGNGHATIWRGLCRALSQLGHSVTFFERDVSYYANHRDLDSPQDYELVLYSDWCGVGSRARQAADEADAAIVTSYCPDAVAASDLILDSLATVRIFYDLDSPVTLYSMRSGSDVDYIPSFGLEPFDLVLSYAGGQALHELQARLGARRVAPLYGSVDPAVHKPVQPLEQYSSDLSYLGTYASDRQQALAELFLQPAQRCPDKRFLLGGALYPDDFPWRENVWFVRHVPPPKHPSFYCSSRLTLNITRKPMVELGYCPSGRLFEAAACGTAVITDQWDGLAEFFEPGREILVASSEGDVMDALELDDDELRQIGIAARERVLAEHTAAHRGKELISLLEMNQ